MEPTPTEERKEASKKEKLYLVIIFALLIGNGVLVWQLIGSGQNNEALTGENAGLSIEKDALKLDLEELGLSFGDLETDNSVLASQIEEQKAKIEEFKAELEAAGNDKSKLRRAIARLKKETGTLREIMKGYVGTIDSLGRANVALTAELGDVTQDRDRVTEERDEAQDKNDGLSETVRQGQVLQTFNVTAGGIRLRGGGSQTETNRASRATMIKSCFGLRENKIAKAGSKQIFVRIIAPNADILSDGSGAQTMDIVGGSGTAQFTVSRSVDYKNDEMDVCVYYELPEGRELASGNYIVELYTDEEKIGSTTFSLK